MATIAKGVLIAFLVLVSIPLLLVMFLPLLPLMAVLAAAVGLALVGSRR